MQSPTTKTKSLFNLLKRVGFALLLLGTKHVLQAQPPETLWMVEYGEEELNVSVGGMVEIPGGDVIIAGSFNNQVGYACRYNSNGTQVWMRRYFDETSKGLKQINAVLFTQDSSIVLAGSGYLETPPTHGVIVKINLDGDTVWRRQFPVDHPDLSSGANWCIEKNEGSIVIAGLGIDSTIYSIRVPYVACFSPDGEELWHRYYRETETQRTSDMSMFKTVEGGIALASRTRPHSFDPLPPYANRIWKLSEVGDILVEYSLDSLDLGTYSIALYPIAVMDDGYVATGSGDLAVKLNANFEIEWVDSAFLPWLTDGIYDFTPLENGEFLVHTAYDRFIGPGGFDYIYESLLIRMSPTADTIWTKYIRAENLNHEYLTPHIALRQNGGAYLAIPIDFVDPNIGLVLLDRDTVQWSAVDPTAEIPNSHLLLSAFPNPFNSTITISLDIPLHQEISLSLFDILGREVAVIHRGNLNSTTLNYTTPPTLSSGIYFLRAATKNVSAMQKIVLLK